MDKKNILKHILICLFIVCFFIGNTGCKYDNVERKKAIVKINEMEIPKEEIMLYILQIKSEFEQLGGVDVWQIEDFSGGKTANEVARQGALENLIKVKLLVENAADMDISISNEAKKEATEKAKLYYKDIDSKYIQENEISEKLVINTFLEYQLAKEVESQIINNYNPTENEIIDKMLANEDYANLIGKKPEEILSQIKVKHILTITHRKNEQGELIPLSIEEQNNAYKKINEAYKKAIKGENFDNLIEEYSEDEMKSNNGGIYDFSEALMAEEYKKALKEVEIGGISEIVKSQFGYHIFKVVKKTYPTEEEIKQYTDNFIQWEETLKEEYREKLMKEVYDEIYQEWKTHSTIEINSVEWNKIQITYNF